MLRAWHVHTQTLAMCTWAPWAHWARSVGSSSFCSCLLQTQSEMELAPVLSVVVCKGHTKQD